MTECILVGAEKELLVYLWILRGVYQSHTDCETDGIIWPLVLVLMIFLLKMSCHVAFVIFTVVLETMEENGARGFSGSQLDFDKNVNVM